MRRRTRRKRYESSATGVLFVHDRCVCVFVGARCHQHKSFPVGRRKGVIPKLSDRFPGVGTTNASQEKRHRLRLLLTHNRRNSEVAGSNVLDSVTTLRVSLCLQG